MTTSGNDEQRQRLIAIVSILVVILSLVVIFRPKRSPSSRIAKVSNQLHTAIGEVAAEQTLALLGRSPKVIVISVEPAPSEFAAATAELAGFMKIAKLRGGLTVVAVEHVNAEEFRRVMSTANFGFSAERYSRLLEKYPGVDGIVSFVGGPLLTEEQAQSLPEKLPKFVAVQGMGFGGNLRRLFENKVIQVAITPRHDVSSAGAKEPKTGREVFDRHYQVITADGWEKGNFFEENSA